MKEFFSKIVARFNAATDKNDEQMPLTVRNYVLIIAGIVCHGSALDDARDL